MAEAVNAAATTTIIEILKLPFTACIGFGTATATLVSQSMGRKQPEEAAKYGWTSVRLGLVIFGVVGLCEGFLFRTQLLHFIAPKSQAVQDAMSTPMMLMGVVTPLISVALILSEALFGAGSTKFVAVAQFVLICTVLVPGAYLFGIKLNLGLVGIWIPGCIYAALAAVTMSVKFRSGGWKSIKL
jgi:Na+-driven multidrug efflux pump